MWVGRREGRSEWFRALVGEKGGGGGGGGGGVGLVFLQHKIRDHVG